MSRIINAILALFKPKGEVVKRPINLIVIHCAATRPSMDVGADTIKEWHLQRGFNDIGYHFVIRRDGKTEKGRPLDKIGAHVKGHNTHSIGICLVGGVSEEDYTKAENNFTQAQWHELKRLLKMLRQNWPDAKIVGHRDLDPHKACPSFSVKDWLKSEGINQGE